MISYDDRIFRKAGGGDGTFARYRQQGDLVWADFAGGNVRRGTITGTCAADGTLTLAYTMVTLSGEIVAGRTVSTPDWQPDGRVMLREEWQRYGDNGSRGVSYLEEVTTPRVAVRAGA